LIARERLQPSSSLISAEVFTATSNDASREQSELAMAALNRITQDDRELVELKVLRV